MLIPFLKMHGAGENAANMYDKIPFLISSI